MSLKMWGIRRGLVLLATGIVFAPAAWAQTSRLPPGAVVQPLDPSGGEELRRHLTTLADNPRSLSALIGAGRAALGTGDAQAALSFFARAEEISPRDARVKAGMGSAVAQMGQGSTALSLFAEAVALGAPEAEIARDRGLAHDMTGDPRRAQQDYALALRRGEDEEVQRRMALSLAISGQREAALRIIDAQLRRNDRAAWRTQAFVLALTGDAAGADRTARGMMPAAAAQEMAPFFARLAGLSPSQKAMAVHFGRFPSNGRAAAASRDVDTSADPGAIALARNEPRNVPPAAGTAQRRRPGADEGRSRQSARAAPAVTRRRSSAVQPRREPFATPVPVQEEPAPPPAVAEPVREEPAPAAQPPREEPAATAGFSLVPQAVEPRDEAPAEFADVAELVESLPTEVETAAAPPPAPAASRPAPQPSRPAPARPRPAAPAHASRHWVQVAGGADRSALPREFARLRGIAPAELGNQAIWTTPAGATNRLLVGPFPSEREAQDFVNRLAQRDVASFAWTSPAGQEIVRLQPR